MKTAYIIAALIISTALGFTMWAFSSSMTPYVNIKQARESSTTVQVRGKILRDATHTPFYDTKENALRFWIEDANKEQIEVVYKGAKPEAFDTAPETAAHGLVRDGKLYSDNLVVKCPSKYEGDKDPYKLKKSKGTT